MEKYRLLIIVLTVIHPGIFAQNESFKNEEISNRIVISGDINFAWTYLSNLGNLQNLVPSTIQQSTLSGKGKGSVVTLTLTNNKGTIVEEVVKIDNRKRYISYKMISTALPIKDYLASFTVNTISNEKFEVIFYAKYRVQKANRQARFDAFNKLQLELLTNIKLKVDENR
ncbi:MAG: SRPBCC family protein [Rhizobacter sp.]|nr:SRPBCC family protein [Ferruginibacter sp.]